MVGESKMEMILGVLVFIVTVLIIRGIIGSDKSTNYYYRAICKNCGYVGKTDTEMRWMIGFYLPDTCPKCGSNEGWIVELGRKVDGKWEMKKRWEAFWLSLEEYDKDIVKK